MTLETEWLQAYPDAVQDGIRRLAADAGRFCITEFNTGELWRIAMEYDKAIHREHAWDHKTQAARDAWLLRFEKAASQLLSLMAEGPCPAEAWGFPVRDTALLNAATIIRCGPEDPADGSESFRKVLELEDALDAGGWWTLADSIDRYRRQIRFDCKPKQALRKPADKKAPRAAFIVGMRTYSRFSVDRIAEAARILFDDEAIDARLVRRLSHRPAGTR